MNLKVLVPSVVSILAGFAFYLLSEEDVGKGLVLAGVTNLGVGWAVPNNEVGRH